MLFIDNKYTKWYFKIIESAQLSPSLGYLEKHHVLPQSMGGPDDTSNIVSLSPKQHFVCHLLLTKMVTGSSKYKMGYALFMMSNVINIGEGRYKPNSHMYAIARKRYIEAVAEYWTPEQRKKNSEEKIAREYHHTTETKKAISNYQKNKKWTKAAIYTRDQNNKLFTERRRRDSDVWVAKATETRRQAYFARTADEAMCVLGMYNDGITNVSEISRQLNMTHYRVTKIIQEKQHFNL